LQSAITTTTAPFCCGKITVGSWADKATGHDQAWSVQRATIASSRHTGPYSVPTLHKVGHDGLQVWAQAIHPQPEVPQTHQGWDFPGSNATSSGTGRARDTASISFQPEPSACDESDEKTSSKDKVCPCIIAFGPDVVIPDKPLALLTPQLPIKRTSTRFSAKVRTCTVQGWYAEIQVQSWSLDLRHYLS
jgi:hypothetical protein